MTCREKLKADHPEWTNLEWIVEIENKCPMDFGYLKTPEYCCPFTDECIKCWSREIPEEPKKGEPMPEEKPVVLPVHIDGKIVPDLAAMTDTICNTRKKLIANGFNKEETFWIIKTMLEGIVK